MLYHAHISCTYLHYLFIKNTDDTVCLNSQEKQSIQEQLRAFRLWCTSPNTFVRSSKVITREHYLMCDLLMMLAIWVVCSKVPERPGIKSFWISCSKNLLPVEFRRDGTKIRRDLCVNFSMNQDCARRPYLMYDVCTIRAQIRYRLKHIHDWKLVETGWAWRAFIFLIKLITFL